MKKEIKESKKSKGGINSPPTIPRPEPPKPQGIKSIVEEINILNLQDGDILVIKLPEQVMSVNNVAKMQSPFDETKLHMEKILEKAGYKNIQVIIASKDCEFEIIRSHQ